jgi:hypothetical protein
VLGEADGLGGELRVRRRGRLGPDPGVPGGDGPTTRDGAHAGDAK